MKDDQSSFFPARFVADHFRILWIIFSVAFLAMAAVFYVDLVVTCIFICTVLGWLRLLLWMVWMCVRNFVQNGWIQV